MSQIKNKFLAQMATLTLKGNNTGGTANPLDLTVAQVNAILPVFTSSLNGLAPSSGGGTTNFLRADGTWAAPGGSGTVTSVALTVPSFLSVSGSPITTSGTLAVTLSGTALPIANGGTGQTSFSTGALSSNGTTLTSGTLSVPNGGTGESSFTPYSVLCGGTTSTNNLQQVVSLGSAGQVLTSNGASALPTWNNNNGGVSIAMRAHGSTSTITGTYANIAWTTTDFDTNSAFGGTNFTCPVAGKYRVACMMDIDATYAVGNSSRISIMKNGVQQSEDICFVGATAIPSGNNTIIDLLNCAVNDTITIQALSSGTSPTVNAVALRSVFTINYEGT